MSIRTRFNPLGTIGRKSLLPAGYIELEYLESAGAQYIDTGVIPWSDMLFYIDAEAPGADANLNYALNGSTWNNNPEIPGEYRVYPWHVYNNGATVMVWGQNNVYYINESKLKYTGRIAITVDGTKAVINGDVIPFSVTSPASQCGDSIYIFNRHNPLTTTAPAGYRQRIYEVRLDNHRGGKVHMIPALDQTGRPCMYDLVGQKPYYNKGTGEFLWRAKLPKGYTALEYLESTGTQRIFMPRISDLVNVTTEHTYTRINSARSCVEFWQNTVFLGIKNTGEFYFSNKTDTLFSDGTTATVGTRYKMILNENGLTVNGHLIPGTRGVRERPEYVTVGLFSAQNADYQCWLKKYYWIETLSGKMVRCVVPALDASNRPCMFDLVKRKTYYNQGTREFLYG